MPHEKFDDLNTRAPSNALRLHRIGRVPCGALSAKAKLASGLAYSREHFIITGTPNAGVVTFEELGPERTNVKILIDYQLEGILEKAGDALGIPSNRVEGDLMRFRQYIERKFKKSEFHRNGADVANRSQFYRDAAVSKDPTHEEIAARAYEIFLKRGLAPGRDIEDWLQAEKELIDEKKR